MLLFLLLVSKSLYFCHCCQLLPMILSIASPITLSCLSSSQILLLAFQNPSTFQNSCLIFYLNFPEIQASSTGAGIVTSTHLDTCLLIKWKGTEAVKIQTLNGVLSTNSKENILQMESNLAMGSNLCLGQN